MTLKTLTLVCCGLLSSLVWAENPRIATLEKQAAENNSAAMVELAQIYYQEGRTEADRAKAFTLLTQAKQMGDPAADRLLTKINRIARNLSPNDVTELKRRAEQGDPTALTSVAVFYIEGRNHFPKDVQKGVAMLEKAIQKGSTNAATALGIMYLTGKNGVPRDRAKGETLIRNAAQQGNDMAQYLVTCLNSQRCKNQ